MTGQGQAALDKRMLSVDVARGIAVVGMIFVNAAAYVHYALPAPMARWMLHADWAGFLLADFVFPAFLFIVGVSIALSLSGVKAGGDKAAATRHIVWRSVKLVLLGIFLSNVYDWYYGLDWAQLRWFGVLQRIGLVYCTAALIFLHVSTRTMAIIAGGLLVGYTALLYVPLPDGTAADLSQKGVDIACWLDRAVLGTHAYYDGEAGYDPEGILSTIPGVAQALLGALAGLWLKAAPRNTATALRLGGAGAGLILAGVLGSLVHPIIKDLWTLTFVLVSSGITLIILALAFWWNDVRGQYDPISHFCRVFGTNAIATYTFHFVTSFLVVSAPFAALYHLGQRALPDHAAALLPVIAFIAMNWLFAAWLWKRRIFIKI